MNIPVADPGGGGPGGQDPPFVPRCRLFNIGPKIEPPSAPPPFLLVDLIWTPLSKILDPPLHTHLLKYRAQSVKSQSHVC